jgi:ribosomal protein L37E
MGGKRRIAMAHCLRCGASIYAFFDGKCLKCGQEEQHMANAEAQLALQEAELELNREQLQLERGKFAAERRTRRIEGLLNRISFMNEFIRSVKSDRPEESLDAATELNRRLGNVPSIPWTDWKEMIVRDPTVPELYEACRQALRRLLGLPGIVERVGCSGGTRIACSNLARSFMFTDLNSALEKFEMIESGQEHFEKYKKESALEPAAVPRFGLFRMLSVIGGGVGAALFFLMSCALLVEGSLDGLAFFLLAFAVISVFGGSALIWEFRKARRAAESLRAKQIQARRRAQQACGNLEMQMDAVRIALNELEDRMLRAIANGWFPETGKELLNTFPG